MSHEAVKFAGLCLSGSAQASQIDDFVDLWHDGDSDESLPDFLGLTGEEYALWVEKPGSIHDILSARLSEPSRDRGRAIADR